MYVLFICIASLAPTYTLSCVLSHLLLTFVFYTIRAWAFLHISVRNTSDYVILLDFSGRYSPLPKLTELKQSKYGVYYLGSGVGAKIMAEKQVSQVKWSEMDERNTGWMWKTGENLRDVTYPLYLYLAEESIGTNKYYERGEMERGGKRE